jgi:oligopeptide/dipeptide ABC transporter ATP-binding protein
MSETILEVKHLKTYFYNNDAELRAVDDLSYEVHRGECVAIIGESGSGKSVQALSILRLVPYPPGLIVGGEVLFHGKDLLQISDEEMRDIRGSKISMIFQEPSTALNPVIPIGKQICETLRVHRGMGKKEAMEEAVKLLDRVNIPNAAERVKQYPHEFSGGMQQRAMIAMAMACNPDVLIADEPTTALDVTVQAQVLEELNKMRKETDTALIIITHNLGVVARYADSVKIVYGGKIVEEGSPQNVFEEPQHPYTLGLIRAVPRLDLPKNDGLKAIEGEPPDMSKIPADCCAFFSRCKYCSEECKTKRPELAQVQWSSEGHRCACFHTDMVVEERANLMELNELSMKNLHTEVPV